MNTWLILGSGGHGRSVADAIRACGDEVLGFLDDGRSAGELVDGHPVLGPLSLAREISTLPLVAGQSPPGHLIVALGRPSLRQYWQGLLEQARSPVGTVVHPLAAVSSRAHIAPGCVVLAGAVVNANAQLDHGVLVNSGAVVDHDAICNAYSHLGVGAVMSGGSRLCPLVCLSAGEVLACGQTCTADIHLAVGAADLSEGIQVRDEHCS